jgi:peptidoglycan/xylan/chitin deacetylase (PgdA/CDA1 family)
MTFMIELEGDLAFRMSMSARRRKRKRRSLIGCLPLAFIFALVFLAAASILRSESKMFLKLPEKPPPSAAAMIIVRDMETSRAVSGAVINVGNKYLSADSNGTAFFGGLHAGDKKIIARAPGFDAIKLTQSLGPGVNEIDLELKQYIAESVSALKPAYLTIDDGPDARWTPQVLDILAGKNVKATFFVIGRKAAEHPALVRRAYVEGHSIGNHTYSHDYAALYGGSVNRYLDSLRKTGDLLQGIIGYSPKLTRPPGGEAGNFRSGWSAAVRRAGYQSVLWNISSGDGSTQTTGSQMIVNIDKYLDRLQKNEAPIILIHDANPVAIEALPEIIADVRRRGYRFEIFEE